MSAPSQTFAELGVEPALCEALAEQGITTAFPIQALTLPLALTGADIIGQARTGTGKTYGFGLPILQRVDTTNGLQALIIVPTRELCMQVCDDLVLAGRRKGVRICALYGGIAIDEQVEALKAGVHVVVGTPGRLLDLCQRKVLDLSTCTALVLDEADEMLDLGFLPDVEELISQVSPQRQTLLFSATMPAAIIALGRRYMATPTFMRAESPEDESTPDRVEQYFFLTHRMNKPALCARILSAPDVDKAVVFCSTKRMADKLATELAGEGLNIRAIHSGLTQDKRERTLKAFRSGKVRILCATEVAARGLDIDDVTHVINFDTPEDEHMYLHRIGRTGRAGHAGVAVTLVLHNELPRMQMILRELDIEAEIPEMFSTSPELVELFDLGPIPTTRKRTNAYGTVDLAQPAKKPRRKVRKTIRKAAAGDEESQEPNLRRRQRTKEVHDEGGQSAALTPSPPLDRPALVPATQGEDGAVVERTRNRIRRRRTGEPRTLPAQSQSTETDTTAHSASPSPAIAREEPASTPAEPLRKTSRNRKDRDRHPSRTHARSRGGVNRSGAARPKGKVSAAEARGTGKPLLRRPMRIDFLP